MNAFFLIPNKQKLKQTGMALLYFLSVFTARAQLKVLEGGKVGIGTDVVDHYKVHINSDIQNMCLKLTSETDAPWSYVSRFECAGDQVKLVAFTKNNSDNAYVLGNGQYWGTGFYTFSDARLKHNVKTIEDPISKIMRLRGVYYTFNQGIQIKKFGLNFNDTSRHLGFLAQEVNTVIPEVVDSTPGGSLAINYLEIIALLTAGIQQQQAELNDMKVQLNKCCDRPTTPNPKNKADTLIKLNKSGASTQSSVYYLAQNKPNPFSENTSIEYTTPPSATHIQLMIFDMQGKLIKTYNNLSQGNASVQISANELQPGMYLYTLLADGNEIDTKRMILSE